MHSEPAVVFIGNVHHIEIWEIGRHNAYYERP